MVALKSGNGEYSQALLTAKVASLFILGISALFCAVLPIILVRKCGRRNCESDVLGRKTDLALGLMLR